MNRAFTDAAIGGVAFAAACLAHELVGHGGARLASGGVITRLSSVYFTCRGGGLAADLGGPLANLVLAALCAVALRRRRWAGATRDLIALVFAFNLLWGAGCMLLSAVTMRSDFAYAIRVSGLGRAVAGLSGLLLALGCLRAVRDLAVPRETLRIAYLSGGAVSCMAALVYAGPVLPALREAALESFGAMSWLLLASPRTAATTLRSGTLPRWGAWALPLALACLLLLGHGYLRA